MMGIFDFNPAELETFLYVFFRVAAILTFMPILGSTLIPVQLKAGLILLLSVVLYPMVAGRPIPQPQGLFELAVFLLTETIIGYSIAYAARLVFSIVQVAGTVIDFQMGFGVVNVIDPQTNSQVSISAQFQNILAILIFFATDAHHFIIQALVESFYLINPFAFQFTNATMEYVMYLFTASFMTAAKIAAPLMAILFFLSVGLGLVARTVPQMNVFIIGFPLQIAVGLIMTGLSLAFFNMVIHEQFLALPARFIGLMNTF